MDPVALGQKHSSIFYKKNYDVAELIDSALLIQWTMERLIKLIEPSSTD